MAGDNLAPCSVRSSPAMAVIAVYIVIFILLILNCVDIWQEPWHSGTVESVHMLLMACDYREPNHNQQTYLLYLSRLSGIMSHFYPRFEIVGDINPNTLEQ